MQLTPNYGLKKPEGNDVVNIEDFNDNTDILDEKLKSVETEVAATKKSVSDGKAKIAAAITLKKVATAATDTFAKMAENIIKIISGSGNAQPSDVLNGRTFTNSSGVEQNGTMINRGAVSQALDAGGSYTVSDGYHNGNGRITANSLASQTPGTAAAAHILSGLIAWVNGVRVEGTIPSFGGQTIDPRNYPQTSYTAGNYCSGNVTVNAVSNLNHANIKKGVVVGGVTGTWEGYIAGVPDLYYNGANAVGWMGNDRCRFDQTFIAAISGGGSVMSLVMGNNYNFMHYTQLHVTVYNANSQNTPFRLMLYDGTAIRMEAYWSSVGVSTQTFVIPEGYRTTTRFRIDIGLSPGGYISRIYVS